MVFNCFFLFCLTVSAPKNLKNLVFEIPTILQSLNKVCQLGYHQEGYRIFFQKTFSWRKCLLLPVLKYCQSKEGWCRHPAIGIQGTEELNFYWKIKKMLGFSWNCLKNDWLTNLAGSNGFSIASGFV